MTTCPCSLGLPKCDCGLAAHEFAASTAHEFAASTRAKLTLPSRSLLDGGKYIHSDFSQIGKRLERVSETNPNGRYPEWPGPITNCNLGPHGAEQREYERAAD